MSKIADRVPLDWFNLSFITAVHLLAVFGTFTFSWKASSVALLIARFSPAERHHGTYI
jgi:hypothetical protein